MARTITRGHILDMYRYAHDRVLRYKGIGWPKRIFLASSLVLIVLSAIPGYSSFILQLELPNPTGPYAIGTRFFLFKDENRPDQYSSDPSDFREISVQVWYPAEAGANETPKNFGNKETAEFMVNVGLFIPSYVDEVALRPSHSFLNAEMAREEPSYPVILYSASGVMDANILLAEELASHGYVVFCIGHPHWCEYYFDVSGEVFFRDKENDEHNKRMWEEENSEIVNKTKEQLTSATTVEEKLALQRKLNDSMPLEVSDVRLWVEDIGFLIDELEKMNLSSQTFEGKLDLNSIGIIGYSKGGAAAGQACITEKRCKAGINLSGFMFGDIGEKRLTVPFMVIEGVEPWCEDCLPINDLLFHTSKSSIYMVQVHGATHGNFTDLSTFREYLTNDFQGVLGPIDGRRFLSIQSDYVLQFFNKHLKGLPAPLLDGPPRDHPEVKFKSRLP
jgi:predicted dienelactone hydrolase